MQVSVLNLAEENLLNVSGERDVERRRNAVRRLWNAEGVFIDAEMSCNGQEEIEEAAGALLSRYPEYDFSILAAADGIPGVFRLTWAFGAAGLAPALTGVDVVRTEAQKVVAVYRFVDGAAF